ncbi:hypothetical protein OAV53_00710 [Euryarchaeota archaeon]|nr:hypothetical protein [Euryarchaeota archaeon]
MTDGGLLGKAINQKSDDGSSSSLVAATIISDDSGSNKSSLKDIAMTLSYGAIAPFFIVNYNIYRSILDS